MPNSGVAIQRDRHVAQELEELEVSGAEEEKWPDGFDNRRRNDVVLRQPDEVLDLNAI